MSRHPGIIEYVDGATHAVIGQVRAEDVPEAMRFFKTAAGQTPVVRVVKHQAAGRVTLREYGPDGALLRSTVGFSAA
jgi:hypothetical protein